MNKQLIVFSLLLLSLWLLVAVPVAAGKQDPETEATPTVVFEEFWRAYEAGYPAFGLKGVDWSAIREMYKTHITDSMSDEQLFTVLCRMVSHLNDNHITVSAGEQTFSAGSNGTLVNGLPADKENRTLNRTLIRAKYLEDGAKDFMNGGITIGILPGNVGYLELKFFPFNEDLLPILQEAFERFADTKALIVDVRGNGGGVESWRLLAGIFADKTRVVGSSKAHTARGVFTDAVPSVITPRDEPRYDKPVVLLTSRFTISAADHFALAMSTLPHVSIAGERTAGAFSIVFGLRLQNGWFYSVPAEVFVDYQGAFREGTGVMPHYYIELPDLDDSATVDPAIDFALQYLASDPQPRASIPATEKEVPKSFAFAVLKRLLNERTTPGKVMAARQELSRNRSEFYASPPEIWQVGAELIQSGDHDAAAAVLDLIFELFPQSWNFSDPSVNWNAYLETGNEDFKEKIFTRALKLNPDHPMNKFIYRRAVAETGGHSEQ